MVLNINVFQEPRGVMRVIQFVFAIWAFAKTVHYENHINLSYCSSEEMRIEFGYPFQLDRVHVDLGNCTGKAGPNVFSLYGDFSSDARFFVATGVLSMLYCVGVSIFYISFDSLYESNATAPMADFAATLLLAVFWLSGSAAWANGLLGLKSMTSPENIATWKTCMEISCSTSVGSFSGLNISVTLGFLNFFLWAGDLWFLYKETQWFQKGTQNADPSRLGVSAA